MLVQGTTWCVVRLPTSSSKPSVVAMLKRYTLAWPSISAPCPDLKGVEEGVDHNVLPFAESIEVRVVGLCFADVHWRKKEDSGMNRFANKFFNWNGAY